MTKTELLGGIVRYLAEVLRGGDHLNDWLTHVPAEVQPALTELGRVLASTVG